MFHTKVWFLLFFPNLVFTIETNSSSLIDEADFVTNSILEFVHLIMRHGDRSPVGKTPGDRYDISFWPDGWGELTTLGKRQHYQLGKWLRRRYNNFLPSIYSPNDIYVQSTDVDRTLMSAEANLAALYPPRGFQAWNYNLNWQPVPVHTRPIDMEYLIASTVSHNCLSYQKAYGSYLQSKKVKKLEQEAKPFFDLISAKMGAPYNTLMNLTLVRDTWICENSHNLPIPKWATQLLRDEEFQEKALAMYIATTGTPHLAKYFTGFLLKNILDRLASKVAKTLVPDRKFWIYSAHDSNVFGFLYSLGISDNQFPVYTATIILELRSYKNEHYVQIFYKNQIGSRDPKPINIPGCGIACPLTKMYEIYDNIIPKNDFDIECQKDE